MPRPSLLANSLHSGPAVSTLFHHGCSRAPVANTFGCAGGHPFNATDVSGIFQNCSGICAAPPDGGADGNTVNAVNHFDRKSGFAVTLISAQLLNKFVKRC